MKTRVFSIASEDSGLLIREAAEVLVSGGLLAIPTETVYGLGANGLNASAVRRIFEAKGRPQDNPLILHIPDASWLERYCQSVPLSAYRLAERFWPGPLTMILQKKDFVPPETTGGLDTVGMRCPDHAVTRAIIAAADIPVAAPSANISGRPSCTTAQHVIEDMDGKIDGIVDGGPCAVGVESTIIDLTVSPPRLLRPGGLPLESLREVLGEISVDQAVTRQLSAGEQPRAPGMKYRHYAPKAPVSVVTGEARSAARFILSHAGAASGIICFDEFAHLFDPKKVRCLGSVNNKLAQAQHVFDALRSFDETDVPEIWAQCPDSSGLGLAIGNRLKKAAGFHVESAEGKAVVFGITGGTGAGKTSLLRALESAGAYVLDCDAVYHEMLANDAQMLAELKQSFPGVFLPNGTLDRKTLGALVFADPAALKVLDDIVHRHIPRELSRRMEQCGCSVIGLDAIKLFESGLSALCDRTIAVTAPEEIRVQRIMKRDGISEEYAWMRIKAQRDNEFFRAKCDAEFVNDFSTVGEAQHAAEELVQYLLTQLKEEKNGKEKE